MKICFSTLACPDWTWNHVIEAAREYGYDGVEIRFLAGSADLLAAEPFRPENHERTLSDLKRHGLEIACLASSVRFDYLDRAELDEQHRVGREYVDLCQRLGAPALRVFGDKIPEPSRREQTIRQVAEGLDTLGRYAESRGVDVLIETHGDFCESATLREAMQRVTSPAAGVLWDTHHPWRFFGEKPADTWQRIGRWVRHTHWKDSVAKPAEDPPSSQAEAAAAEAHKLMSGHRHADYTLFGEGEFPAVEVLGLLHAAGYDGWYSLEWEKKWHPEIADPEVALPPFPAALRAAQARVK
jgi:sugar phosphate isomerase/epimerase